MPRIVYSSRDGHLGCFHLLTIVNRAAINTSVQKPVWVPALISFKYITKNGIAVWCGHFTLNFLRNHLTIFHIDTPFYIPINSKRVSFSPHPCPWFLNIFLPKIFWITYAVDPHSSTGLSSLKDSLSERKVPYCLEGNLITDWKHEGVKAADCIISSFEDYRVLVTNNI